MSDLSIFMFGVVVFGVCLTVTIVLAIESSRTS